MTLLGKIMEFEPVNLLGDPDEVFMQMALRQAQKAFDAEEVPVGAVIEIGGEIIGAAHNQRETIQDPTAHAEILAITQAASILQSWRLEGATLYVTLEPCSMCAGAIVLARIDRVVFGAKDPKAGACGSVLDVTGCEKLNHMPEVKSGVLEDQCSGILTEFFQMRRKQNKGRP
jgi:tRNA(adenine34) deaminase